MKSDREYLDHISEEIAFIENNVISISKLDFMEDPILKRAIVRSIEIIGEAVKNISIEMKTKYSSVEWRKIGDMRNRLIHGYFAVDYDIVWDIALNKITDLKMSIANIQKEEKELWE